MSNYSTLSTCWRTIEVTSSDNKSCTENFSTDYYSYLNGLSNDPLVHSLENFKQGSQYAKGAYGWALKQIDPKYIGNIFELGANNGSDTKILSKLYPKSIIVAVEALPEHCEKIRQLNLPNVIVVQKAITDRSAQETSLPPG